MELRYLINGVNAHDDRAGWGIAQTNAGFRRDVLLMKQCGFNFIRECHNPHDVSWDDACDQLGMLAWPENYFWGVGGYKTNEDGGWRQSSYPTKVEDGQPFEDNLKQQLTEFIRERRNHPSIIVWSMGNETFDLPGRNRHGQVQGVLPGSGRILRSRLILRGSPRWAVLNGRGLTNWRLSLDITEMGRRSPPIRIRGFPV